MTITIEQYFGLHWGRPEVNDQFAENATGLLVKVNALLDFARQCGLQIGGVDPDTGTEISGARGGSGDGGFRGADSKTGTPKSEHRFAHGIDVYDPRNQLDMWLTDEVLEKFELYREHDGSTPGWCHLQDVPPRSGRRTFYP